MMTWNFRSIARRTDADAADADQRRADRLEMPGRIARAGHKKEQKTRPGDEFNAQVHE